MADNSTAKVSARATGVVAIAVMCSRILGLIREQVFAGLFGAGRNLDAFLMAFRVPNLLRDLFAEGALSTAFITTFSGKIATEGYETAWRLANKVATLTVVFMSGVTLLGILFAPQVIHVMTWWQWSPEKTDLTILLTRVMWPFILLVSLAALVMGMLNAKHIFGPPAMAARVTSTSARSSPVSASDGGSIRISVSARSSDWPLARWWAASGSSPRNFPRCDGSTTATPLILTGAILACGRCSH